MCKICGETKHEAKECWMRHVTLNNKEWTEGNMGSPLQIDLSRVIKSPVHKNEDCPICMERIEDGEKAMTYCGHFFCFKCIQNVYNNYNHNCPLCREGLNKRKIFLIEV